MFAAAMFAVLPPGSNLVRHRDPFAGSLRYHLGLKVPQDAPSCRIFVDGQPYHWKEGEAVMFDETYIHHAENLTDETRLILFCDVERPMKYGFMTAINRWVSHHIVKASATQNMEGEDVGVELLLVAAVDAVRCAGVHVQLHRHVGAVRAVVSREQPVVERGAGAAKVQAAGGAAWANASWGTAYSFLRSFFPFLPSLSFLDAFLSLFLSLFLALSFFFFLPFLSFLSLEREDSLSSSVSSSLS